MNRIVKILGLINEGILFSIKSIKVNRTRTVLSLLGITIGIFSIISVFTVFDSIEAEIHKSIDEIGSNVLFVQKWAWSNETTEYPWWVYMKRPEPNYYEFNELANRLTLASNVAIMYNGSQPIKYKNKSINSVSVTGVSYEYNNVQPVKILKGRYFTSDETQKGKAVAILGYNIANELIDNNSIINNSINIFGQNVFVIGILEKDNSQFTGNGTSNTILLPFTFVSNYINTNSMFSSNTIIVKAKPNIKNTELSSEIRGIMRSLRRLKPEIDDTFSLNETSIITNTFDSFFKITSIIGWIIGGFSLLVGGFGIANIMFVSVKERTSQIGIQKSLGAKKTFILFQFIIESVILSILGGIIGLLIIFTITLLVNFTANFNLFLSFNNIIIGLSVSAIIGLLSGFIPALNASNLDPVEAMRSNF